MLRCKFPCTSVLLLVVLILGGFREALAQQRNATLAASRTSDRDEGTRVARVPRGEIRRISEELDRLVESQLAAEGQQPNPAVTDDIFLRRVYLDIVGRIPSYQESRDFAAMPRGARRQKLIDQLLDSPGHVSHEFNWWADLLRLKQRLPGGNPGATYLGFVKQSLAENKPYDQFVRELLTSSGSPYERENAAVGYYLRDFGMPEDNMSNTVRLFLGTRLECAQCHDHPFDVWTQQDYYRMVAFTGNIRYRADTAGYPHLRQLRQLATQSELTAKQQAAVRRLSKPFTVAVEGTGTGLARLPDDYQYSDGQPNQIVTAKTIFGPDFEPQVTIPGEAMRVKARRKPRRRGAQIPGAAEIDSRVVYAQWVTSPDNERFAQVMTNRIWKRAMGRGLFEPVDNLNIDTEIVNQELLDYLSDQFLALGYDIRQLQRAIFNSRTYQRQATTMDVAADQRYLFSGPILRRMSGEQMWDSLLTLAIRDLDDREFPVLGVPPHLMLGDDIYDSYAKLRQMSPQEIIELAKGESKFLDNKGASPYKRRVNKERVKWQQARAEFAAAMESRGGDLRREFAAARRAGDQEAMQRLTRKRNALRRELQSRMPRRVAAELVRASELPAPARPGHFVREFGQSDREQIENSFQEGSVTQALALMNGQLELKILGNPNSVLMEQVFATDDPSSRIEVVFQSMLQRQPTVAEMRIWVADLKRDARAGVADLVWTLGNSHEFMFVR